MSQNPYLRAATTTKLRAGMKSQAATAKAKRDKKPGPPANPGQGTAQPPGKPGKLA
jgi:hypothetical protein